MKTARAFLVVGAVLIFTWAACEDDTQTPEGDVTAPARVTNLAIDSVSANSITLTWTAPGDDGTSGRANRYVLKRSGSAIDASNFSAATTVPSVPAPANAGTLESFTVPGLDSTLTYYFALRAFDDEDNASPVSNNATWIPPGGLIHLTKVIPSFKDNTLYEEDGLCDFCPGSNGVLDSLSNGAGEWVFAGRNNNGDRRRGLMAFAIVDSIAAGATIDSVVLTLQMSRTISGAHAVAVHRVLADWGEGISDASCCAPEEGTGGTATVGDATWAFRIFRSSTWTSPGGDFVASASASTTIGAVGAYTWRSTPMATDVQSWLDTPATNFGWILVGDETANASAKRFNAHESGATGPRLTVYYSVPAP